MVVAPEARRETVWPLLCDRVRFEPAIADNRKSASITDDIHLILTSWRAPTDSLSAHPAVRGDRIVEDIAHLKSLCERQDRDAFPPVLIDEVAPAIPRRLQQLDLLIDDATNHAVNQGVTIIKGLNRSSQSWGYGRWLKLGDTASDVWAGAWFGIHQELWASSRETPLWLSFSAWEGTFPLPELRLRLGQETALSEKTCLSRSVRSRSLRR